MRSFFGLVGFEYKKIFIKKSTLICMALVVFFIGIISVTTVTGSRYWHSEGGVSSFEAMKLDRETIQSKSGYIDDDFIKETLSQNIAMIGNKDNYLVNEYGTFLKDSAYIEYVLPYEKTVDIINTIYETDLENLSTDGFKIFNITGKKPIDTIASLSENDFYDKLYQTVIARINNNINLSEREKEKHIQMLSDVRLPFYNASTTGYFAFIDNYQFIAVILLVLVAICISPIFAGEYQARTDQLVLSSKRGKNIVILAKLFTGISFVGITVTVILFVFLLTTLSIHGFNGFNVALQTLVVYCTYPVTMLQAVMTSIIVTIFISILFAIITMALSARFKSPFAAVIISFCILFIPLLIFVKPSGLSYKLLQLFPAHAIGFKSIFSEYLFELFGRAFTPSVFYIMFTIFASIIIMPLAYYYFKNHQMN